MKETILFWALNVIPVTILVGWIEVYNDTNPPGWIWAKAGEWGKTKFVNPYWEKNVNLPLPFIRYITWYHLVMFCVLIPLSLAITMTIWGTLTGFNVFADSPAHWSRNLLAVIVLFASLQAGVMGVEDFVYFALQSGFNWLEPHALRKVFHGEFAWFKGMIPLPGGLKFPGHWVFMPAVSIGLLCLRQYAIL